MRYIQKENSCSNEFVRVNGVLTVCMIIVCHSKIQENQMQAKYL